MLTYFCNIKWVLFGLIRIKSFDFTNSQVSMTQRISKYQRFKMMNPVIQFFKFIYLSIKIMLVVAGGHGGTRKVS